MKAAVVRLPASLESLAIEERPEPVVRAGMVKVRWHALSLNFHDYAVAAGLMPTDDGRILVSDGAGEIVEVGADVHGCEVGDRVLSLFFPDWHDGPPTADATRRLAGDSTDGCACEYSVVDPATLTPMPSGWRYGEAATLPCAALTAWRGLVEIGQVKAGDRVLVEGSGGVSIFALQLAKAFGASVIATTSSAAKRARLIEMGADHVIDYNSDENWGETVHGLTDGGVDHVIDVGGPATLAQSVAATRVEGNVVLVGILGGLQAEINLAQWMLKQQRIRPVAVGSRAMQRAMVSFLEGTTIKPVVDAHYELDRLADAFRYQLSGQHFGKIVIDL